MPQIIQLRRSSVAAKVPTLPQLQPGELAVNTTDGKLFLAKTGAIVEIGAATITGDISCSVSGQVGTATLSNSGVTAGSYSRVDVDAKGRVTGGSNAVVGSGVTLRSQFAAVTAQSGTSVVTLNNTTPVQGTFGTQVWSNIVTPSAATSRIQLSGSFICDAGTSGRLIVAAVFRGTVCIGVTSALVSTTARPTPMVINLIDSPNTVAATTYTIRVGVNQAATWYVAQGATAYFNGLMAASVIKVSEVA